MLEVYHSINLVYAQKFHMVQGKIGKIQNLLGLDTITYTPVAQVSLLIEDLKRHCIDES